jgi:hypothetical protein
MTVPTYKHIVRPYSSNVGLLTKINLGNLENKIKIKKRESIHL